MPITEKIWTKNSQMNLEQERAKQDLAKQFPEEQHINIFIYELVKFDEPDKTFVANTTDGTLNVSGFKFVKESIMYIESEFKSLFTTTGSQLTISDNRKIYGYIKEDLDYNNRSYFITQEQFSAGDSLKQVYMIDNNNQYDKINSPEIERIQLKPMAQELSFSNTSKWILIDSAENNLGLNQREGLTNVTVTFKNPEIALSGIDISGDKKSYNGYTADNYLPFSVIPNSIVGSSVNAYSPQLDPFINSILWLDRNEYLASGEVITPSILKQELGELNVPFLNILSICHMVQTGFTGVLEEGYVPSAPSTKITPSAGWYWKTKLEDKEPKAIAAEIQNLIDLNIQASLSGQIYGDIDSNNVHGNISTLTNTITEYNWKAFFSLLGSMYPQIFSNYTLGYGGGFNGDSIIPFKVTADHSEFTKGSDGSEMYKFSITGDLLLTSNFSTPTSKAGTVDFYKDKSTTTIFYYEGDFNTRTAGEVYVIDFKYAEQINNGLSTGDLRNKQNAMITSPNAVAIGKPNDWSFTNNSGWKNNVAGAFQIPQSVFKTMDDPVFYYALTEEEINDYYNEGGSVKDYSQAKTFVNGGDYVFGRGYPRVPDALNIIKDLKANTSAVVEYFIAANSVMRDDYGSNNDYKLVMQDPDVTVRNLAKSGSRIGSILTTDVTTTEVVDGTIPYTRPAASLVNTTLGKSMAENTDVILGGPKVFIKGTDIFNAYNGLDYKAYSSLSDIIFRITKGVNQSYTINLDTQSAGLPINSIGLSTLGEGSFSINLTYRTNTGGSTNILIDSNVTENNIYSNSLYIDSTESFVNTYTLINFGEE